MPTARSLSPALVAAAVTTAVGTALIALVLAVLTPTAALATVRDQALSTRTTRPAGAPLAVTITSMSPSAVPDSGPIDVSGTVTNRDTVAWSVVRVYGFVGTSPLTTSAALATAAATPASTAVGARVTEAGSYVTIPVIGPGQTVTYHLHIPHADLIATMQSEDPGVATGPGVYFFGVHALGQTVRDGRDNNADGRARTFLPMVPDGTHAVDAAILVPLRREVTYAADGSLDDVPAWTRSLRPGGRLAALVAVGAAADGHPVSWVVDPAVVDAVRRLAAGNPARSIEDTLPRGQSKTESPSPSPSPSAEPASPSAGVSASSQAPSTPSSPAEPAPSDGASADPDPDAGTSSTDPVLRAAAQAAVAWLADLRSAVAGQEVLALPYGDLDVAAAAQHDRGLYTKARAMSGPALAGLGVPVSPVVGAPSGYVDTAGIDEVTDHATILATDQLFGGRPPGVARVHGHTLVVTSSGAATGGPGPGDRLSQVNLRQRLLAEAAVRALAPGRKPLVTMLPGTWTPHLGSGFFSGLDVPWLSLTTVATVAQRPARTVAAKALDYPAAQHRAELHLPDFDAVNSLVRAGVTLQNILSRNDTLAGEVLAQGLASASYADRAHPRLTRLALADSEGWIHDQLSSVRVRGPSGVTLSGGSGRFAATVANDLDVPVEVTIEGRSDGSIHIDPDTIDVAPHSHQSVLLDATATGTGVHRVSLVLADGSGRRFHSSPPFTLRSAQVSKVIWLFIIGGLVLLFGAAGIRLVRRVRAAARERSLAARHPEPLGRA